MKENSINRNYFLNKGLDEARRFAINEAARLSFWSYAFWIDQIPSPRGVDEKVAELVDLLLRNLVSASEDENEEQMTLNFKNYARLYSIGGVDKEKATYYGDFPLDGSFVLNIDRDVYVSFARRGEIGIIITRDYPIFLKQIFEGFSIKGETIEKLKEDFREACRAGAMGRVIKALPNSEFLEKILNYITARIKELEEEKANLVSGRVNYVLEPFGWEEEIKIKVPHASYYKTVPFVPLDSPNHPKIIKKFDAELAKLKELVSKMKEYNRG